MEPKKTFKPLRFNAKTTWQSARRAILSGAGKPDVVVGSPPEFRGDPDVWPPEELLLASLNTCTMLTFFTLSQAKGVIIAAYQSEAECVFENVDGVYRMTAAALHPRVTLEREADLAEARHAMERVEDHCFIAKSITAKITTDAQFSVVTQH